MRFYFRCRVRLLFCSQLFARQQQQRGHTARGKRAENGRRKGEREGLSWAPVACSCTYTDSLLARYVCGGYRPRRQRTHAVLRVHKYFFKKEAMGNENGAR